MAKKREKYIRKKRFLFFASNPRSGAPHLRCLSAILILSNPNSLQCKKNLKAKLLYSLHSTGTLLADSLAVGLILLLLLLRLFRSTALAPVLSSFAEQIRTTSLTQVKILDNLRLPSLRHLSVHYWRAHWARCFLNLSLEEIEFFFYTKFLKQDIKFHRKKRNEATLSVLGRYPIHIGISHTGNEHER